MVLKALAFRKRGKNKDAYELFYHIRNYGSGVEDITEALKPLLHEKEAKESIKILSEDFTSNDSVGAVQNNQKTGEGPQTHTEKRKFE